VVYTDIKGSNCAHGYKTQRKGEFWAGEKERKKGEEREKEGREKGRGRRREIKGRERREGGRKEGRKKEGGGRKERLGRQEEGWGGGLKCNSTLNQNPWHLLLLDYSG
jgi:hypothetical protein